MRSVARRSEHFGSPGVRSRSQERSVSDNMGGNRTIVEHTADSERCDVLEDDDKLVPTRLHRRAMSDPFDNADKEEDTVSTEHIRDTELPTLPRYPMAETRDRNCWSEPDVSIFHVRGPNYLRDGIKVASEPYLLRARGCDLFLADSPHLELGRNPAILGGALRKEPTLLIKFRFPWGILVLYYAIPSKFTPFLRPPPHPPVDGMSPSERCLALWLAGDDDYKNQRLKLIPYVSDGPWIVRNMVTGRPAIIGNKLPVTYRYEPSTKEGLAEYLECDMDIGNSSKTAKRIVSVCRRYMSDLSLDVGFVVQGDSDDLLPEQMLGSIRVHGADPLKAPNLG